MLLTPLLDKFKLYIMGGLTIAVAALTIALYVTSSDLDACKAGRSADRASYQLASAQAEALALRQKHEVEMKYAQVAQQADENFRVLRDRYHANVVRYEAALLFDGVWSGDGRINVYPVKKPSYTPDWKNVRRVVMTL